MALCRFKIDDKDYEEFKRICKEQKTDVSDMLRGFVATIVGHNVSTSYDGHHKNKVNVATIKTDSYGGHDKIIYGGHDRNAEVMMATILQEEGYTL